MATGEADDGPEVPPWARIGGADVNLLVCKRNLVLEVAGLAGLDEESVVPGRVVENVPPQHLSRHGELPGEEEAPRHKSPLHQPDAVLPGVVVFGILEEDEI